MADEKTCRVCGETKSVDEFYFVNRTRSEARDTRCKQCKLRQHSQWSKTSRGRAAKRHGKLRRFYGINADEYQRLIDEQDGVCAICGQPETKLHRDGTLLRLSVDHDHETGKVRGLLCQKCNVGLGSFEDEPEKLRAAAMYIEKHSKTEVSGD